MAKEVMCDVKQIHQEPDTNEESQSNTLALENQSTITEAENSDNLTPNASQPSPGIYDFSADGVNHAATLQLLRATFEGKIDEMKSLLAQDNIDLTAVHKSGKNIWDFAILNGAAAVIECLLEVKNQKVDLTDLLFKAAKMGSQPIVEYFTEVKDVNPHFKNAKNESLLCAAIAGANVELVLYLIKVQGLRVESTAENCPLCEAVAFKNLELIDYFLEAGLPIEGVSDGKRPILHAAEKSNLKIFKYLLEKGAKIDVKYEDKGVFDYAAIGGNLDIMLYLVKEKNFNFDANFAGIWRLSVLFAFVRFGSLEHIKYLIEVEQLSFKDKKGPLNGTILHEAVRNKNLELIKYFVEEHDLNIILRDDNGYVPLFYAVESNNLAGVKYFMEERNLSIHLKDFLNRTALHIGAMNGHLEIVRYLVEEKKLNVNAKDNGKATPLLLTFKSPGKTTANSGHLEVMKYLWETVNGNLNLDQLVDYIWLEKYGNNSAVDKGKLLFDAAYDGNFTLIKFLIEDVGMDANVKDKDGRTPIFSAVRGYKLEAVTYFVESAKVDLHVRNNDKKTVIAYAFSFRYYAIESYLASKGASW